MGVIVVDDDLAWLAGLDHLDGDHLLAGTVEADLGGVQARSATVKCSTGLDFAAAIPLKEG